MMNTLMTYSFITFALLSFLGASPRAEATTCSFTEANWEINVKGNDPGVRSLLGAPTTDITQVPGANGCFRHHERGSIYWNESAGTHFVMGAIRNKWAELGWEREFLGFPVTDETATPDGAGRFNHFQGGSIYWHPSTGAYEVHGDIRELWSTLGWERGFLGYPLTDSSTTPDTVGRFNHFQGGSIYWTQNLGAHYVMGAIRNLWAANGWERNPTLGYPISNELTPTIGSPNRFTDFENGVVYWNSVSGQAVELFAFPPASRDRADFELAAQTQINELLVPHGDQVYVDRAATIADITKYTRKGFNDVVGREVQIDLRIKYKAEFLGIDGLLPDPYSDLKLWLSVGKRRTFGGETELTITLTNWSARTHVPSPTSGVISAGAINARLRDDIMKNILGKAQVVGTIPSPLVVLSVKVMANGDLKTYIEPL